MPSWARVGAKVVCVDPNPSWANVLWAATPAKDCIYTIREIVDGDAILVEEIRNVDAAVHLNDGTYRRGEPCFGIWRFRPLITQQDDIATHFKALLDVPEQVGA